MAHPVANIVVPIISVGFMDPAFILTPMMVAGIIVMHEVFKARKVIIAGLAVVGSEFSFCNSSIAFSQEY